MVPAGSVLTYQATIATSSSFQTADDVVQQMNQTLGQSNISMRDYHIGAGILDTILAPVNGKLQFQLTATLQTNADFNSVSDVQSIADHGIYMATDALPLASSVPNVTIPGGASSSTGQPGQADVSAAASSIENSISGLFAGVQGTIMLIVLTILGLVLILGSRTRSIGATGATFG